MGMKLPPALERKALALAGGKPAKRTRKLREVVLAGMKPWWALVLRPACRVVTEANTHEHWTVTNRRRKAQKAAVQVAWVALPFLHDDTCRRFPLTVTLIHQGPRMDDDNLARAFKAIRDELASVIGVNDGSEFVAWRYEQRPGEPCCEIRIESRG